MRFGPRTLLALALVPLGCSGDVSPPEPQTARRPRDARWEPICFATIDERAHKCGLTRLRRTDLPRGAAEIRVWAGFGNQPYPVGGDPLEGVVLKRSSDRFSGTHYPRSPTHVAVTPSSGWPEFWEKLESAGVFDLPDSSELQGYRDGLDGISYVVETRRGDAYRTYMYWNPASQNLPEAKRLLRLLQTLRTETGFDAR